MPDTLAIDIGSYSVKGAVISPKNELKKYVTVPTPHGAIESGIIRNPEQVSSAVKVLWKTLAIKEVNVISSVPGQNVFVRPMLLPMMKKKEMASAVKFQAEGQIPIPPTDLVFDYSVIGENKEAKQMEVLVVATRKSVIQQLLFLFNQAELQLRIFDLESLALARVCFNKASKAETGKVELIASIGAANTHLCIFEGEIPRFTRSIPFGGERFTKAISLERSIGFEAAEERKLAGDKPDEVESLMNDMASEIKRSIDFYLSQRKEHTVNQVILAGGGARLSGLQDFLADKLQVPVIFGSVEEKIKIPKHLLLPDNIVEFNTSLAPVLGLAVRGMKA